MPVLSVWVILPRTVNKQFTDAQPRDHTLNGPGLESSTALTPPSSNAGCRCWTPPNSRIRLLSILGFPRDHESGKAFWLVETWRPRWDLTGDQGPEWIGHDVPEVLNFRTLTWMHLLNKYVLPYLSFTDNFAFFKGSSKLCKLQSLRLHLTLLGT